MNSSSEERPPGAPLIIGHRGAAAVAPENTLVSFRRAIADGADGIEFDVRLAQDGVPVVIHDPDLRRTGLTEGSIASLSSSELVRTTVGNWFNRRFPRRARPEYDAATIPTLAEVFEYFHAGNALLYVEMKCLIEEGRALALEVARLVREHALVNRVVVESFTLDAIAEIKRIAPEIRTAALFEPKWTRPAPSVRWLMESALAVKADEIALHRLLATRRITAEARRRGLKTVVWTVDNPSYIERALDCGIHALITNDPARFKERG